MRAEVSHSWANEAPVTTSCFLPSTFSKSIHVNLGIYLDSHSELMVMVSGLVTKSCQLL